MMVEELEWKEEYGIGVDSIDNAHQEFFRILRRLFLLTHQKKSNKWVAEEGIKFLKNYTLRHFEEEENYMRSIGYRELPLHTAQHDYMRAKILPRLETQLALHEFSEDAVDKFLTILLHWLRRHILGHDKGIGWAKASPGVT